MEVRRIPNSELSHHGKDGQKWGVMHGPPYPLDKSATVQAKKKKKSLMTKIKDKKKGKMLRKAKEAKKKEREEKEKVINSGDAKAVKKISNKLNEEEMARALKKIEFNAALDSYNSGKKQETMKRGKSYLDTAAATMQTIGNMAQAAGNVYSTMEKMGVIKKGNGQSSQYNKNMKKYQEEILKQKLDILENGTPDQIMKILAMSNGKKQG